VPPDSAIIGRPLRGVLLPQGSLICLVIDAEGTPRLPASDTVIKPDDILVAVANIDNEEGLRAALTSPS
jgi:Trk K+ transport system NAD-binding subunit